MPSGTHATSAVFAVDRNQQIDKRSVASVGCVSIIKRHRKLERFADHHLIRRVERHHRDQRPGADVLREFQNRVVVVFVIIAQQSFARICLLFCTFMLMFVNFTSSISNQTSNIEHLVSSATPTLRSTRAAVRRRSSTQTPGVCRCRLLAAVEQGRSSCRLCAGARTTSFR